MIIMGLLLPLGQDVISSIPYHSGFLQRTTGFSTHSLPAPSELTYIAAGLEAGVELEFLSEIIFTYFTLEVGIKMHFPACAAFYAY